MTVYVDDWRQLARVGRLNARWSHMFAGPYDDLSELHRLASRIGLRRDWFQDEPWPHQHYDLTESKRVLAIAAGAVAISWREGGRLHLEAIRRDRAGSPTPEAIRGSARPVPSGHTRNVKRPGATARGAIASISPGDMPGTVSRCWPIPGCLQGL